MSYAIFDETFYLESYPDVDAAVKAGMFKSGRDHFEQIGLKEGQVLVSRLYDESFYLQKNPDIAGAVTAGAFKSGLDHFIQFGETEGRAASLLFDEGWYRRRYPDIEAAVENGTVSSGLQHYILFGEAEGRSSTPFNEFGYFYGFESVYDDVLYANADVKTAVAKGIFKSGLEHYLEFGQFENREAIFLGTSGNDTVRGFGEQDTLCGVDLSPEACYVAGTPTGGECLEFNSLGVNEKDVLIGGNGKDTFVLGNRVLDRINVFARRFYVGNGDADFAVVRGFELRQDAIVLAGFDPSDYLFNVSDGNLNIFLSSRNSGLDPLPLPSPDLVAVVEGVTTLSETDGSLQFLHTFFG